jgi:adenine-specific DNA methylase
MNFDQFKFKSVDGKEYSLNGLSEGKEGLLVVFTSVQCPYALSYFEKLDSIAKNNKYSEIAFILVSSNATIDEDVEDLDEMKKDFPSLSVPFIRDEDKILSSHFKATFTPECLLLNKHYEILYRGPMDNRLKSPEEWSEEQEGF